jgi:hypothetical protein
MPSMVRVLTKTWRLSCNIIFIQVNIIERLLAAPMQEQDTPTLELHLVIEKPFKTI